MADVASEFRRVQTAYAQPTLRLLSRPTSVAVLTIFRLMFSVEKPGRAFGRSAQYCSTRGTGAVILDSERIPLEVAEARTLCQLVKLSGVVGAGPICCA